MSILKRASRRIKRHYRSSRAFRIFSFALVVAVGALLLCVVLLRVG